MIPPMRRSADLRNARLPLHAAITVLACATLSPCVGRAEENPGSARILPSLGTVLSLDVQKAEATVDTSSRGAFSGHETLVFPSLTLDAELLSPSFWGLPGEPRLFVHGGPGISFDGERNVVKEGTPGTPLIAVIDANNDGIPDPGRLPPLGGTRGLGSAVQTEVSPLVLRAGGGLAFRARWKGRVFWFKPSVIWQRQRTEVTTLVSAAESISNNGLCPCRTIEFREREAKTSDMIGPALELEMETARAGSFVMTLFVAGQAFNLLGNRSVTLDTTTQFDDGTPMQVHSLLTRDDWSYAGQLGFRFRWHPEE
jgi:hypothetical protein